MGGNILMAIREIMPLGGGRLPFYRQARTPFIRGTDGARHKAATAIGAYVVQLVLHAIGAERAFVAADAGELQVRWQIPVTIFAIGAQFQSHGKTSRYWQTYNRVMTRHVYCGQSAQKQH